MSSSYTPSSSSSYQTAMSSSSISPAQPFLESRPPGPAHSASTPNTFSTSPASGASTPVVRASFSPRQSPRSRPIAHHHSSSHFHTRGRRESPSRDETGGRGLTMQEVQDAGMIDPRERSREFEGIPVDEVEIKKLPKKLRGYYTELATIRDHYLEVDALLSGELPSTIAQSFASSKLAKRGRADYTKLWGELEEEAAGGSYFQDHQHGDGQNDDDDHLISGTEGEGADKNLTGRPRTPRARQSSLWKVKRDRSRNRALSGDWASSTPALGRSHESHYDSRAGGGERIDEEQEIGEGTRLLDLDEKEERREKLARLALNVNTVVNVLLVAAKAVAVLYSSSISLTASLVDSALDLLSTFIILGTSWAIGVKTNEHLYPAGKRRFEPLGVLIFSVAMIASFVQVFIESFERAVDQAEHGVVDLSVIGMATMLATIGIKAVLWVWCSRIPSSGVQALAQDAENDVFFNIMSLAFPYIGSLLKWRLLDPIGGMVLSLYIIFEWVKTLLENFANLSGKSASKDQITRVLYLVSRFNPVLEIGDVECYHIGDDLLVEVDVILPRSSTLHFAHDVGETIQCMLESLDGVIRAYVHTDYSSENPAQHTTRKQAPSRPPPNGRAQVDGDGRGADNAEGNGVMGGGSAMQGKLIEVG